MASLRWLGFCCGLLLSPWLLAAPNVVLFVLDDVGQGDIGALGNQVVQTPQIDALAREGMRFSNAFVTTSSCSPSRASILTGQYPTATGAPALADPLPASLASLPQALRRAGYYTASVGKWHLGEPFKTHFDRVVEASDESGASEWLNELARRPIDKPFFFWFASKDAHDPFDWHPPLRHQDPRQLIIPPWAKDDAFTRLVMSRYYNEIARADYHIGSVVERLRREDALDNTIVVVVSDNGAQIGDAKSTLYDEGLKTPLVIRWPAAVSAGAVSEQLVSTVDLMPTILDLVSVDEGEYKGPGLSLRPMLADPQKPVRTFIYAERNRHGRSYFERALRTKNYLYKRNYLDRRLCNPQADLLWDADPLWRPYEAHEALYDLHSDPLARHNLLPGAAASGEMAVLRARMNRIMQQNGDRPPPLQLLQCPQRPMHERILLPREFFQSAPSQHSLAVTTGTATSIE